MLPLIISGRKGFVIVPTYELAQQTYDVARMISSDVGICASKITINLEYNLGICTAGKFRELKFIGRYFCCIDEADMILQSENFSKSNFGQFIFVSATFDKQIIHKNFMDSYLRFCNKIGKDLKPF